MKTGSSNQGLTRPIRDCIEMIYPTPVVLHRWPDSGELNRALTEIVLAAERDSPASTGRSNVGGWHSDPGFVRREDPPIRDLAQRIQSLVREATGAMMAPGKHRFSLEGWANVLRRGQYNSVHVHPNSTWSGVYYVTGNPPPEPGQGVAEFSGKIEFLDPRPAASATYAVENIMQRRSMLNPDAGTMLLFPSWLQHQVHPYFGPGTRISIAFNVVVAPA